MGRTIFRARIGRFTGRDRTPSPFQHLRINKKDGRRPAVCSGVDALISCTALVVDHYSPKDGPRRPRGPAAASRSGNNEPWGLDEQHDPSEIRTTFFGGASGLRQRGSGKATTAASPGLHVPVKRGRMPRSAGAGGVKL